MLYLSMLMNVVHADETCPSYSSFRLPAQLILNPANETATPASSESESKNCKEYVCTKPEDWTAMQFDLTTTLSVYIPKVVDEGLKRKRKINGVRE